MRSRLARHRGLTNWTMFAVFGQPTFDTLCMERMLAREVHQLFSRLIFLSSKKGVDFNYKAHLMNELELRT